MKHLAIGGSTAKRTINCPAWIKRAEKMPRPKSNVYADEGNLLHDAMEQHYLHDKPFSEMVGELSFSDMVLSEDHLPLLELCRSQVEGIFNQYNVSEFMCEPFVQLIPDKIGGSIDLLAVSEDKKTVVVLDYKTGRVAVDCEENEQLLFYALCASEDKLTSKMFINAENLVLCIVQPRVYDTAQVFETSISSLSGFKARLLDAVNNDTRAATGDHCQYCPASPVCPDRKQQARSALLMEPKTADEVAEAFKLALDLELWTNEVKKQAENIALSGVSLPGFKLVQGRSNRRLTEKAKQELPDRIGDSAYEIKLKSLTQLEKLLGKGELEQNGWVEKPAGAVIVVPESDKRGAVLMEVEKNLKFFVDNLSVKK